MVSPSYRPGSVLGTVDSVMNTHSLCPLGAFKPVAITSENPPGLVLLLLSFGLKLPPPAAHFSLRGPPSCQSLRCLLSLKYPLFLIVMVLRVDLFLEAYRTPPGGTGLGTPPLVTPGLLTLNLWSSVQSLAQGGYSAKICTKTLTPSSHLAKPCSLAFIS